MSREEFVAAMSRALAELADRERQRRRDREALVVEAETIEEAAEAA